MERPTERALARARYQGPRPLPAVWLASCGRTPSSSSAARRRRGVLHCRQFARYFRRSPDRLNQTHLRTYQAYLLRERKLAPRTVKLHVCAIRFLFNKILQRRYLVEETPYPKTPRRLPTVLTGEEVQRLIVAARTLTDRTMLMVLYSTGMRNAEMRHLQIGDIDSRAMLIHIRHGKGGHDRYVPLSAALLATLREHWRWMQPRTYLFPGTLHNWRVDRPITPKGVWDACRKAGLQKQFGKPHRYAWVALAWLDDERIARRNRHT